MVWLLFGGLGGLVVWLAFVNARKRGAAEQAAKSSEKTIDNVKKAQSAVSYLSTDPAERQRLRDKFTRK